jgi:lipopolysaccharide transport system permease protein
MSNQELIIEPGYANRYYMRDIWRNKRLALNFAWRDLLIRYRYTVIGVLWIVLRTSLTVVVFSVIFGRFAKLPSFGVPYPLLVFMGTLPWQLFSAGVMDCSSSLLGNSALISKIYFPRLLFPISSMLVGLTDFTLSSLVLVAMMLFFHVIPGWGVLVVPFLILFVLLSILSLGVWAAALVVRFRDIRMILPFIIQLGTYISPVGYSSRLVPEKWHALYYLNPMAIVIEGFRWALLGIPVTFSGWSVLLSVMLVILLLCTGYLYFRQVERTVADIV